MSRIALALCCTLLTASTVVAAPCDERRPGAKRGEACASGPPKFEPIDRDKLRASRDRPGFIDLGNGTEVRIGGRTRAEYTTRHW